MGSNQFTKWFFAKWLRNMPGREKARQRYTEGTGDADSTQHTAQEANVNQARSATKQSSEGFFSGDNPIVVVMSILGIFVGLQVLLHPR